MKHPGEDETRLSWVLAAVAGLLGSAAFTVTGGYFVTFMTGNAERGVLGYFTDKPLMAAAATVITLSFVTGVVVASVMRRRVWANHPHGATVLTTASLAVASLVDSIMDGWNAPQVEFVPILFLAFGIGALNTSFCKNGEVSIPLSYVTGTLVKMGQGIERHVSGGSRADWMGYLQLYMSFVAGALIGGLVSLVISNSQMLIAATVVCAGVTTYTHHVADRSLRVRAGLTTPD